MKARLWISGIIAMILLLASMPVTWAESEHALDHVGALDDRAKVSTASSPSMPSIGRKGQAVNKGYERIAETEWLALDFNPETAAIQIVDLVSGSLWSSNPQNVEDDEIARGAKKLDLQSQLLINYVDPQFRPFQLNSFTGSVKEKTFTWEKTDGGIIVTFEFPKAGFVIPVSYAIEDDYFTASILTDGIEQNDKYKLVNLHLLPFFGAGGLEDEGYMLIPDGSGALIKFNNNKHNFKSYNQRVYGTDAALTELERKSQQQSIHLPVFGLKKNRNAFLAVIHQGAYQAGIIAEVSRKNNSYNTVYSYMNLMESDTNVLMEGTWNEKQVLQMSEPLVSDRPFEVRYYFMNGDEANYVGMAHRYRQYLAEEHGVAIGNAYENRQIPLLLDVLGGVVKRKTFLGIPYNTVESLTSYADLSNMTDLLRSRGLNNLAVRYEGWMKGGVHGKVPVSIAAESKLGGDKGFRSLVEDMNKKDIAFYPVIDPISYYKGGNGFRKFSDVAKGINRAPAVKYEYRLSDGTRNRNVKPWMLLKPESVKKALERYAAAAKKYGLKRTAIQHIGSTVYSDFRKNSLSRGHVGDIWEQSLSATNEQIDGLMFEKPGAYTFAHAESLAQIPLYSSEFDVSDETVPFYSIVTSGWIPTFSDPINLSSNPKLYKLKLIETGTYPAYRFIARDASALKGTRYDSLYSAEFNAWLEDVVSDYNELNNALSKVIGQEIVNHEQLAHNVYRTTFANGVSAIVNYSNEAVNLGFAQIEAGSYLIQ